MNSVLNELLLKPIYQDPKISFKYWCTAPLWRPAWSSGRLIDCVLDDWLKLHPPTQRWSRPSGPHQPPSSATFLLQDSSQCPLAQDNALPACNTICPREAWGYCAIWPKFKEGFSVLWILTVFVIRQSWRDVQDDFRYCQETTDLVECDTMWPCIEHMVLSTVFVKTSTCVLSTIPPTHREKLH